MDLKVSKTQRGKSEESKQVFTERVAGSQLGKTTGLTLAAHEPDVCLLFFDIFFPFSSFLDGNGSLI